MKDSREGGRVGERDRREKGVCGWNSVGKHQQGKGGRVSQ